MIFRQGGRPSYNIFFYDNKTIDIVNRFNYLGIVFTTGGSYSEEENTLAGLFLNLKHICTNLRTSQ